MFKRGGLKSLTKRPSWSGRRGDGIWRRRKKLLAIRIGRFSEKVGVDANGTYYVCDVIRTRSTPYDVERIVKQAATMDGMSVGIRLEQEPGSAGKTVISHYRRNVLLGYSVDSKPATGDKVTRAKPMSAASEQGRVKMVRGAWNAEFLDELCSFPGLATTIR